MSCAVLLIMMSCAQFYLTGASLKEGSGVLVADSVQCWFVALDLEQMQLGFICCADIPVLQIPWCYILHRPVFLQFLLASMCLSSFCWQACVCLVSAGKHVLV